MRILELILYKAFADLKSEQERAFIGFLWWFVEPTLYVFAFYLIFAMGLHRHGHGGMAYVAFLVTGLVPWKWISATVVQSSEVLIANKGLMTQAYLPKWSLLMSLTVADFIKFLIVFMVMLGVLAFQQEGFAWSWIWCPVVILTAVVFTFGASSVPAAVVPLMRDFKLVVDNAIIILMFLSGVFFDVRHTTGIAHTLLTINPLAQLMIQFRVVLLEHHAPDPRSLGMVLAWGIGLYAVGGTLLHTLDRYYPKVV